MEVRELFKKNISFQTESKETRWKTEESVEGCVATGYERTQYYEKTWLWIGMGEGGLFQIKPHKLGKLTLNKDDDVCVYIW